MIGELIGHVCAVKSGHDLNNRLLRNLFARRDAWRYVDMVPAHQTVPARARDLATTAAFHRRSHLAAAGD